MPFFNTIKMIYYNQDGINVRVNWPDEIAYPFTYDAVLSLEETDLGAEPVTRQEAKDWCYIDGTSQDAIIDMLITAARDIVEKRHGQIKPLVSRTITAVVKPGTTLPFNYGNTNVSAIVDEDGEAITGDYQDITGMKDTTVTYTVTAAPINTTEKIEILKEIAKHFENRGDE